MGNLPTLDQQIKEVERLIHHYTYKVVNPLFPVNIAIRKEQEERLKTLKTQKLLTQ